MVVGDTECLYSVMEWKDRQHMEPWAVLTRHRGPVSDHFQNRSPESVHVCLPSIPLAWGPREKGRGGVQIACHSFQVSSSCLPVAPRLPFSHDPSMDHSANSEYCESLRLRPGGTSDILCEPGFFSLPRKAPVREVEKSAFQSSLAEALPSQGPGFCYQLRAKSGLALLPACSLPCGQLPGPAL